MCMYVCMYVYIYIYMYVYVCDRYDRSATHSPPTNIFQDASPFVINAPLPSHASKENGGISRDLIGWYS